MEYVFAVEAIQEIDLFPSLPRNTVVQTIRDEWNALRRATRELDGIIGPADAAKILGVSRQRVHQLIKTGAIRAVETENFIYVSAGDVHDRLANPVNLGGRPKKTS